jgi:hypothetical protein
MLMSTAIMAFGGLYGSGPITSTPGPRTTAITNALLAVKWLPLWHERATICARMTGAEASAERSSSSKGLFRGVRLSVQKLAKSKMLNFLGKLQSRADTASASDSNDHVQRL